MVLISTAACLAFFLIGGRKKALVPSGMQNVVEVSYEFIDKEISTEVIGHDGHKWTPFLGTLFFWLFSINMWSTVPVVIFPATSRIAIPLVAAVIVWFVYVIAGFVAQGPKYIINSIFPPGVPWLMYILITPIEIVSVFIVRPASLAIRLFANMFAGHILIALFAIMTSALLEMNSGFYQAILAVFPFIGLVIIIAFEMFVAILQAYIFTTLAAVYIQSSISEEH